ncbi:hypothetical protein D3C87_1793780 [compost metagenome]
MSPDTVWVAVQLLPPLFVGVTAVPPMVTVGVAMASEAVKLEVMTSPDFARLVVRLFEAMVTVLSVGIVLS